jgi:hypothetical protein
MPESVGAHAVFFFLAGGIVYTFNGNKCHGGQTKSKRDDFHGSKMDGYVSGVGRRKRRMVVRKVLK